jgi:hypothetical protein
VKKAFLPVVFLLVALAAGAQTYSFQDSLRMALERINTVEATTVAAGVTTAWGNLGPDQQRVIKQHALRMKRKRYPLAPQLLNYHGAWVGAVTIEKTEPARLTNYLNVAGQVIDQNTPAQANVFFAQARDFFEHHALSHSRTFRLKPMEDEYRFDYVYPDTTAAYYDPYAATDTAQYAQPPWMQEPILPSVLGPVIRFSSLSLVFATAADSVVLQRTQGLFGFLDKVFVGEGGRFNWSSTGLPGDSVYYDFKKYYFKTTTPALAAGQGRLTYIGKLRSPVPGKFEYKSEPHKRPGDAKYPRFTSYESNIRLTNLGADNVSYTGGFSLTGPLMGSQSASGMPATLEIKSKDDRKVIAQSTAFVFQDSTIQSSKARIALYQGYDSITHPSLQFTYRTASQLFIAAKDKSSLRKAPFTSSYFDMDFSADQLLWDMKTDSLNISIPGSGNVAPMILESNDFFSPDDYRSLRGVGFTYHPLVMVVNYCNKYNLREFNRYEIAADANINPEQARMAMEFLAAAGMLHYDAKTGRARVYEKAFRIVDAYRGKADYDNMKIQSYTYREPNATLDLNKRAMKIRGVEKFNLSDSLNVIIKPDSAQLTLLQNRDLKFNGVITAGNFEITGKDFTLKYDSFFINLNKIDSIRFFVTDKNGNRKKVDNAMMGADSAAVAAGGLSANATKSSGTLFINAPNNKAGLKKIPNYPRLDATGGGVIYFDRPEVLAGAYDRSIFFVVPPFKLDSLSDADPSSINFDGTFVTSGMFPGFKEKLHTMPDKSLGFTHVIPKRGYPLFRGDGKVFGNITVSNAGVRVGGKIEYLAASLESPDFIFYPDSVTTKGNVGEIKEKQFGSVNFPQLRLPEYKLKWLPKEDKMNLKNTKDPFSLYQNTATLDGQLTVSKAGVFGSGKLSTRGSELISKEMNFTTKDFGARHARFSVLTTGSNKPALAGNDVRLKFNLTENVATVSPEIEGEAAIEFPYAQFKTSIPQARWDLNTQKITMTKAKDVPLENSYFYTTRKDLDSLRFNADKAEYDIKTQQLKVSGIPYIIVADAKITPENNEVLILENAKIGTLKNTVIVIDTINEYHRLTAGVVDIVSRKEFGGYATYQYVNAVNDTFAIKMTDFHLETVEPAASKRRSRSLATQQTVGTGAVTEKDNISIAPRIFYKGDMKMYATRPALQLKGYIKLDLKKIKNYDTWLRFEQSGDEKEIYLDFDNTLTEEGKKVDAGLHFGADNNLYITFVFDKKDPADEDFFLPSGSLFYDKETTEFKIEDRAKATGEKLGGKVFAYNEDKQEVKFEGPVAFFKGNRNFNLTATSLGSGSLVNNEIKLNTFLMADMNVPVGIYDLMARKLQEVIKSEGAEEGLGDASDLLYKIADIVGERVAKDFQDRSVKGYVSLGTLPALAKPITLANVDLKWSQEYKAFYSTGKLGVSNILKYDINAAFEGFMEIKKNEDGAPVFHLFFKASPEAWYYFGVEDNRLLIHTSDQAVNDLVSKKSNAAKAKVGELAFVPGTDEETLAFINRYRQNYLGIEVPYDLSADPSAKGKAKKKKDDADDGF